MPADLCLDFGAHIGAFAVAAVERGAQKVHCMDLSEETCSVLARNLIATAHAVESTGRPAPELALLWGALAGHTGGVVEARRVSGAHVDTTRHRTGAASAALLSSSFAPGPKCPAFTLSGAVAMFGEESSTHWCLAKFDVEGSEFAAFEELACAPPSIILEYHRREGKHQYSSDAKAMRHMGTLMRKAGYKVYHVSNAAHPWMDFIVFAARDLTEDERSCPCCRLRDSRLREQRPRGTLMSMARDAGANVK